MRNNKYAYLLGLFLLMSLVSCQLVDNGIKGELSNSGPNEPIGLSLNIDDCFLTPPEALVYNCKTEVDFNYATAAIGSTDRTVEFQLINNDCPGLAIDMDGQLVGQILKENAESCSVTIRASSEDLISEKSINLTIAPSLSMSFDQDMLFFREGQSEQTVQLQLSLPAPFDTYIDYQLYGNKSEVLSIGNYLTKRIPILKGQGTVFIAFNLPVSAGLSSPIYQQLKMLNGSMSSLPVLSLNSYSQSTVIPTFEVLSVGQSQSCGIDDGKLYCWGGYAAGLGSIETSSSPQRVNGSSGWQKLAAGSANTCGIDSGELYCWGTAEHGALGNNDIITYVGSPQKIGIFSTWEEVSAGSQVACGIKSGEMFCWGNNFAGAVGNGGGGDVLVPTKIGIMTSWDQVSTAISSSCGIHNGELYCWGWGAGSTPQKIGTATNWQSISAGLITCGLESGNLYCWGNNSNGQVGDGTKLDAVLPQQIGTSNLWQEVQTGYFHTCGIKSGELYCWGKDDYGSLGNGNGSSEDVLTPTKVGLSDQWSLVASSNFHTCASNNNELYCWGGYGYGEIGTGMGSGLYVAEPRKIEEPGSWESFSYGKYHRCGISLGRLYCWGNNDSGQLGNNDSLYREATTPELIGTSTSWTRIAAGEGFSCGINDSNLLCWGLDDKGQVGNGTGSTNSILIPQVIGGSKGWTDIAAKSSHVCGIISGELYCWGDATNGKLGIAGAAGSVAAPERVGNSSSWQEISVGIKSSCGIDTGELYCWGSDLNGRIGNGGAATSDVLTPAKIGSSNTWQSISVGYGTTCGVSGGELFCWGSDSNGQLGNSAGSTSDVDTPEKIGLLTNWQKVAVAKRTACGINNGELYCWGSEYGGAVGNGSVTNTQIDDPLKIGILSGWQDIFMEQSNCAIHTGELYCWGPSGGIKTTFTSSPFLIIEW